MDWTTQPDERLLEALADDPAATAKQLCYPGGETVARGPVFWKKMEGRASARPGRAEARPSTIGCA